MLMLDSMCQAENGAAAAAWRHRQQWPRWVVQGNKWHLHILWDSSGAVIKDRRGPGGGRRVCVRSRYETPPAWTFIQLFFSVCDDKVSVLSLLCVHR